MDTTVLVYAVGVEHPLREPCRALVERASLGALQVTTTAEVLQEFAHVRARRRSRVDAAQLTRHWLQLTKPLLQPDAGDLAAGLGLFETVDGLGCFDAVLAATTMRTGGTLVSADRAFGRVDGLSWRDPAAAGYASWLDAIGAGGRSTEC